MASPLDDTHMRKQDSASASGLWGRCLRARGLQCCQRRNFSFTLVRWQAFPGEAVGCEQAGPLFLAAPGGRGLANAGSPPEASWAAGTAARGGRCRDQPSSLAWVLQAGGAGRMVFTPEAARNWGTGHTAPPQRAPGVLPWRGA